MSDYTNEKNYISAQKAFSDECLSHLRSEHNVNLDMLLIEGNITADSCVSTTIYDGKVVSIRIVTYIHNGQNHSAISFCSDDIPALHLPVIIIFTDKPDLRKAYIDYVNARDTMLHDKENGNWGQDILVVSIKEEIDILKAAFNSLSDPTKYKPIDDLRKEYKALLRKTTDEGEVNLAENVIRYIDVKTRGFILLKFNDDREDAKHE